MSSRKKKQNGEQNGSSRNLDGRRLRTVTEAKALAEYLAAKPEMEKKEQEEKRKRWEDIVATTERKQEEILSGKDALRLAGTEQFAMDKAEAEDKTRQAIEKMLQAQQESSEEDTEEPAEAASSSKPATQRAMFGWEDEDDEFMSDSDEEDEVSEEDVNVQYEGKGKGKAP